jgi:homoserine kinase type II
MNPPLVDVLPAWNLQSARIAQDLTAGGSPERVRGRYVLEHCGRRFVLECLSLAKRQARQREATILQTMQNHGCPHLCPWLATADGQAGIAADGYFWQLRAWKPTHDLDRDAYGFDAWRGQVMAEFLRNMRDASHGLTDDEQPFLLCEYIPVLMRLIHDGNHRLYDDLSPIIAELQEILALEPSLPRAFCHGDFHPLNVLWGEQSLNAVIDWEFCGLKPQLYDIANLLGCLGMDSPQFLTSPMAAAILHGTADFADLEILPQYIAAQRLAWMREWFVKKDREMMVQELDFLWLLLDNRDLLARRFREL